jgi:sec-independent protein translocase protein TatA
MENLTLEIQMASFGFLEWVLILIIIILVFGVGRLTRIGKELGKAVSEFRKALKGERANTPKTSPEDPGKKQ